MIGRRLILIFTLHLLGGLLGFVGLFAIARFSPNPEEILGFIGFGVGFVGSFFVLAALGVPAAHIKRISEGEPLGSSIGTFALLKTIQVGLATGATFLAVFIWTEVLGRGFETPLHQQIIAIMLLYYIAASAGNIATTTFDARLETAKSQLSLFVGTATRVAGMVVVALLALGPLDLAWVYVIGAFAAATAAFLQLRRYRWSRPSRRLLRSYLTFAWPLAIPALLISLTATVDKVLIQLFWGIAEVGYYFAVQRVVIFLTVITSAIAVLLFPTISRYHARNQFDRLRMKARQSERYLSMIMAPIIAFLVLYPEGVIHVALSNDFLPAADILRIFAAATFVLALVVPRQAILQGMDRPGLSGLVSLIGAIAILALFILLIPTSIFGLVLAGLGPEGAALSVLIGYLVFLGVSLAFTNRLVGDRPQRNVAYHLLAAVAIGFLFSQILPPALGLDWQWFHLLLYSLAFLLGYLAILTAIKEFRRSDLQLFLELVNPRKMAEYIQEELTNDKRE